MYDHPLGDSSSSSPDWEAIARHLAGEGSVEERRAMEQALAAAPDRAALLGQLERAVAVPDPEAPTPLEVESALRSVLARRDAEPARPEAPKVVLMSAYRSRSRFTLFRAAAAILVVAGAGVLWRVMGTSRTAPPSEAIHHYASAVGAIESVTLSDGTQVLLGPGSELLLAPDFGGTSRELTLVGEARFDVHHDASRPFLVKTTSATFRDVGTVFSVHSDRSDGARIVVSQGAVAMERIGGDSAVTLRQGDRATVAVNGTFKVERAAAAAEDTAWTSGKLLFRDATVAQVVADVRRWYGLDLHVDSALAAHHVSAEFDRNGAADVGRVIAAMLGGGFRQDGKTLYIVPPPTGAAPK